jgi:hypothetical protein
MESNMDVEIRDITNLKLAICEPGLTLENFFPYNGEYALVKVARYLKTDDPEQLIEHLLPSKKKVDEKGENAAPLSCIGWFKSEKHSHKEGEIQMFQILTDPEDTEAMKAQ